MSARFCDQCGEPLGPNARFCPGCRAQIPVAEGHPSARPSPPSTEGSKGEVLLTILAFSGVVLIAVGLFLFTTQLRGGNVIGFGLSIAGLGAMLLSFFITEKKR